MTYLILQHPGHNRVYYNLADRLALAELTIATTHLSRPAEVDVLELEGIRYLSIAVENALTEADFEIISRLSFVFAIYQLESIDGSSYLNPIKRLQVEHLDSKISSMLKYQGKTNELFTRMMINVALLSSDFTYNDRIQLLDPVAGKGTTLFEAAVYGFDTFGIEIQPKPVQELVTFFKKFLQEDRYKHTVNKRQIAGQSKAEATNIQEFVYARSKEAFKSPDQVKQLGIVGGDASRASAYFKSNQFHLIVGDLPYGIFHGSNAAGTRNPAELLTNCLPAWHKVLKKGGTAVVAWNSYLISRHKLSKLFAAHQFEVLSNEPYDTFEHLVDKSIKRDILVAKK